MSKLIGTNPNQIPSNADLGSAAFADVKDFLHSRGSSLSEIDVVIPSSSRNVFIYDTSLDSDGGAWRKRTQTKSWYNEPLNTQSRGSRKEFPGVALIVAEWTRVRIYDADDSNLSLWMSFDTGRGVKGYLTYLNVNYSGTYVSAVCAVNGMMGITIDGTYGGMLLVDFIKDSTTAIYSGFDERRFNGGLVDRNEVYSGETVSSRRIIQRDVNDIDMRVRKHAMIDPETNLPRPTIAVATGSGFSVLHDNFKVANVDASDGADNLENIRFLNDDQLTFYNANHYSQSVFDIPYDSYQVAGSIHGGSDYRYSGHTVLSGLRTIPATSGAGSIGSGVATNGKDLFLAGTKGVTQVAVNKEDPARGMVAYATSDYATGWMYGDIRFCVMSDTQEGWVIDDELVTNTGLGDWTNSGGDGDNTTWTNGAIAVCGNSYMSQGIPTVPGESYVWNVDITQADGSVGDLRVGTSPNGQDIFDYGENIGVGIYRIGFTAVSATTYITLKTHFTPGSTTSFVTFDNITVKAGVADRSIELSGFQVNGKIKKTKVAAGADLVAYSNFSSSNYFKETYNSRLDPVSTSYTVAAWVKPYNVDSGAHPILHRGDSDASESLRLALYGGSYIYFDYGSSTQYNTFPLPAPNVWSLIVVSIRSGQNANCWINGEKKTKINGAAAPSTFLNATTYETYLGRDIFGNAFDGELALVRYSIGEITEEQVRKMYNDEAGLFKENGKAVLYGSSSDVKSIDYDKSTNLIHAGTSQGRSAFQGLGRVDESNDPISYTISSVNGLVAGD